MALNAVSSIEPKKNNSSLLLSAGGGAIAGAGLRYILPTKNESTPIKNFFSADAMKARCADRRILKYGALGALIALGCALLIRAFKPQEKNDATIEYSKLGVFIDTPDYTYEAWYA